MPFPLKEYGQDPCDDITGLIPHGKVIAFVNAGGCFEWVYDIDYKDISNHSLLRKKRL